jgi:hypothetical protein
MRGIIIVIAILVAIGLLVYYLRGDDSQNISENGEVTYCTLDAQLCPDGSYVGRVPPTCEFSACPTATSSQDVMEADQGSTSSMNSLLQSEIKY